MTDEQLTRLLVERFMGWEPLNLGADSTPRWRVPDGLGWRTSAVGYPNTFAPLEHIENAWEVRDRLAEFGRVQIANGYGVFDGCEFEPFTGGEEPNPLRQARATSDRAARAICLCALRALGIDPEGSEL